MPYRQPARGALACSASLEKEVGEEDEVEDAGIIISYDELKILLYNQGFRSCNGILMPDDPRTDEEILRTMYKLSGRGMIENRGDHFVISEEMARITELIGAPQSSYSFCDGESGQIYYCYLSQDLVVVTQNDRSRKDSLIIRRFTPEEFTVWREELERE